MVAVLSSLSQVIPSSARSPGFWSTVTSEEGGAVNRSWHISSLLDASASEAEELLRLLAVLLRLGTTVPREDTMTSLFAKQIPSHLEVEEALYVASDAVSTHRRSSVDSKSGISLPQKANGSSVGAGEVNAWTEAREKARSKETAAQLSVSPQQKTSGPIIRSKRSSTKVDIDEGLDLPEDSMISTLHSREAEGPRPCVYVSTTQPPASRCRRAIEHQRPSHDTEGETVSTQHLSHTASSGRPPSHVRPLGSARKRARPTAYIPSKLHTDDRIQPQQHLDAAFRNEPVGNSANACRAQPRISATEFEHCGKNFASLLVMRWCCQGYMRTCCHCGQTRESGIEVLFRLILSRPPTAGEGSRGNMLDSLTTTGIRARHGDDGDPEGLRLDGRECLKAINKQLGRQGFDGCEHGNTTSSSDRTFLEAGTRTVRMPAGRQGAPERLQMLAILIVQHHFMRQVTKASQSACAFIYRSPYGNQPGCHRRAKP